MIQMAKSIVKIKDYYKYLPDLKESWLLLLIMILGGSVLGGVVSVFVTLFTPSLYDWSTAISYPFMFLPPAIFIYFRVKYIRQGDSVPFDDPKFGRVGAPLFFLLLIPMVLASGVIIDPLSELLTMPEFFKKFLEQVSQNRLAGFVSLAILAPLMEEFFCRGIILKGLLKAMSPAKAILWSALMFGIMHLNPWQALPAFLIGVILGWIYYKSRSIWAVIFIHFLNNSVSFLILVLFPYLPADATLRDIIPGDLYYYVYFLSLIVMSIIILIIKKGYDQVISSQIQSGN